MSIRMSYDASHVALCLSGGAVIKVRWIGKHSYRSGKQRARFLLQHHSRAKKVKLRQPCKAAKEKWSRKSFRSTSNTLQLARFPWKHYATSPSAEAFLAVQIALELEILLFKRKFHENILVMMMVLIHFVDLYFRATVDRNLFTRYHFVYFLLNLLVFFLLLR